ncbi:galactose-binding domain-like protein [Phlebopus sp. FC_14]|nr:galactose-binding domain-like protein [Phlebopus sp. FC_14]
MTYQTIPLADFSQTFGSTTELSSVALGGKIVSVSDEFFAEAHHLLHVEPAPSLKGQYGPNGALYSGWETRRHNPTYDWCIIKLGTTGTIVGFDIDTSHFNGNEAPEVSIDATLSSANDERKLRDVQWTEILPRVPLGPYSRHLFKIPETSRFNHVRLNMYPDGGIARFRVYGNVAPVHPDIESEPFDLAHVFSGGRVVFTSDQHFGVGSNLILPGRGKDMGDGWETKRSRKKGHKDWVVLKLGAPGTLLTAEIDTAHFKGNFPESCEIHALNTASDVPESDSPDWVTVLSRVRLGPHRQHFFQLETGPDEVFTHVKVTIYPDGGIKRVRIVGTKGKPMVGRSTTSTLQGICTNGHVNGHINGHLNGHPGGYMNGHTNGKPSMNGSSASFIAKTIPVLPLTPEAFAPYGQVIQAYGDHTAAPRGTKITPANAGTASKFHKLALLRQSYPETMGASTGLSVYRCSPVTVLNGKVELKVLERHPYTNQAFIPMGRSSFVEDEALRDPGNTYLVIVALDGSDDKPDLSTLRAFIASAGQGIMYDTAVWHQPMTVLHKPMDFTCVETQIGNGDKADCEILDLEDAIALQLP